MEFPRLLYSVLLSIFITGCTSTGAKYSPAPPPSEKSSLVYLFRSHVHYGNLWITNFLIDGKEVVSLYDKGYSWVHISEGVHSFEAKTPTQNNLKFEAPIQAGKTYYVEYTQEASINRFTNVIRLVPSDIGVNIIKNYSYKKSTE